MRLFLLLCLAMISCGGHAPPCSKATCNGCCSTQGICEPGVDAYACGASGVQCQVCNGGAMCMSGACFSPQGTGGGNSGTGGGSVSGAGGGSVSGTGGGSVSGTGGGTIGGSGGGTIGGTGGGTIGGTGGGTIGGTGGGTIGGTGGGTVGGTGGGTTGGTGGGTSSGSCQQTCTGCCSNGSCLAGTDTFACGFAGATCTSCGIGLCVIGQCFGLGGTGGGSAAHGDGGTGTTCTANSDCEADFFETASCMPERRTDGGYTGWTGGYCSSTCGTLGTCPGTGNCLNDGYCYAPCSTPGSGRGACRPGYVCEGLVFTDGGIAPGGVCTPDCHYAGATCTGGHSCSTLGYCQ